MVDAIQAPHLRMPGATLVTRLRVYDTLAPDGQRGGTPHMHLLCSEMYFVTAGSGAVELIDWDGFRKVELKQHSLLSFSPGTIHRLINPDQELELFIVMQNSGLPERGDNIVSFKDDLLADADRYQQAMKASSFEEAYQRRDRGVEGFMALKEAFEQDLEHGRKCLAKFYQRAVQRSNAQLSSWHSVIRQGPLEEAQRSLDHIQKLEQGNSTYLQQASYFIVEAESFTTPGFCGALNRYFDPATLALEGLIQKEAE